MFKLLSCLAQKLLFVGGESMCYILFSVMWISKQNVLISHLQYSIIT